MHVPATRADSACRRSPPVNIGDLLLLVLNHCFPDLFSEMDPDAGPHGMAMLPGWMVRSLRRARAFERFRFEHEYLVAVDGTELFRLQTQHCEKRLTTTHTNGQVDCCHMVLEAKLVSSEGLALSMASGFIGNNGEYDKQDCELEAAYRLLPELKRRFPRLPICITGDSLYACEQILTLCFKYAWGSMLVFKPGRMPAFHEHVQQCLQRHPPHREVSCHAFLTDHRRNSDNTERLVNEGGRQRHKIENQALDTQKNGGYELEHDYGRQVRF